MDTFTTIWSRLLSRVPALDPAVAQDFTRDAINQLCDRREWSWRRRYSAIRPPAYTLVDTCSVTSDSNLVFGTTGVFTPDMIGKQIRIAASLSQYPTYTIQQYISSTVLVLDSPWIGPSLTGQTYSVFQCWFTMPADFARFYSLIDPGNNYRLYTDLTLSTLDMCDPQRGVSGDPYTAVFYDYSRNPVGSVGTLYQVSGVFSDPTPISTTSYGFNYPSDLTYLIRISTVGSPGGALVFEYSIPELGLNTWTAVAVPDANPIDLPWGAQIYWPAGTYTSTNYYTFSAKSQISTGSPRYELWPRPVNVTRTFPFIYIAKMPELSDISPSLPPFVAQRGDIVLKMCEIAAARWPGTSTERNPYYDLSLARLLAAESEMQLTSLELRDDEVAPEDLRYQNWPMAPFPFADGKYIASHAVYPYAY